MVKEKEELEPTLDVETAPFMEPNSELICKIPGTGASKDYWQAQRLASSMHREFEELQEAGDEEGMRERFYVLARYYGRTLNILRSALSRGNEELVNTALHNIIALHEPMHHMHDLAPETVPFVITLDRETRGRLTEDIIVELLQDSSKALSFSELRERVNSRHFMVRISESRLRGHLDNLSERGHIIVKEGLYKRSNLAYSGINMDTFSLRALLGSKIYQEFDKEGYNRLSSIVNRKKAFLQFFQRFSGCSSEMGELFIAVALELTSLEHTVPEAVRWDHVDLNGSQIPRPYQRLIYSIFRAYGYQGQVVEAPTGSGKTLIGMMVIQDWLRSLSRGQSILVLVPTVNYEQQWLRELCYKPIGLQLPPNEVFIGTPSALDEEKNKGLSHSILVLTYTALAQIGSPRGKGGFDSTSIERFIQGNNIQYVILDEVHKAVDDLESVTANVARLLSEWLRDGSIRGLIGFSGTAAAYRERFRDLGLQLVYTLPSADLIAYGFVAPFAEFGVPFAYSDREKRVRDLIEEYKVLMKEFLGLVGDRKLIELFSKVDPKLRVEIARDLLGMYSGRGDQEAALRERFTEWEQADELTLNELPLVSIVQLAESIPDEKLVSGSKKEFGRIHSRLMEIREKLDERIFYEDISSRLQVKGFGKTLDAESALELPGKVKYKSAVREQSKDILASSIVGLYGSLKSFYYRVGEGRVDSISTIIEAERQVRYISGVIVFDRGRRIKWKKGTVNQGYSGVAGLFAHMLGDLEHIPMAVLSSEIYLPHREETSIPGLIAGFIKEELMMGKMGETIFRHLTRGMEEKEDLRKDFNRILRRYVENLSKVGSARRSEFQRRVLNRLASNIRRKHMDEGTLERLDVKNLHLRSLVNTFYDYAMIADRFTNAHEAMLRLTSGEVQRFYVVKMASGDRKVLMYDLASRLSSCQRGLGQAGMSSNPTCSSTRLQPET